MKMNDYTEKQEETEDWIEYITDIVNENYAGREIVLWGKYSVSDKIKDSLKQRYGLETAFYVDGDNRKIDGKHVFSPNCLEGKSSQYYVVIPLAFYQSVKDKMIGGGYEGKVDYYYFSDCVVCQRDDYYEDTHGNKIIGRYQGLKFSFSGFGASIQIGDNVHFEDTCIYAHNNSKIVIGKESCICNSEIIIQNSVEIELGDKINVGRMFNSTRWCILQKAKVEIGSYSVFKNGWLLAGKNSSLAIGKGFRVGENYHITLDDDTSISIGEDCLFSLNVFMRTGDGHTIFDIVSGKNINSTYEIARKQRIDIGSHVWIGMRATILAKTKINNGSIVGAASLVKGIVSNNCIVAGIPARVIRKNISWSEKNGALDISECGCQYVNWTK